MKKKLLVLAIAGAFAAPVAMADTANVNIYGVANMSYDSTTTNTTTGSTSQQKVSSNSSRIGFKGSEDLGGGTNAIYQIETYVYMDNSTTNTTSLGNRNTFAGLSGESWGTVLLGRNDTPYKTSTRRLDLFADGIADNRSLMGGVAGTAPTSTTAGTIGKSAYLGFDTRPGDVVQYNSPNLSGFTVSAQYVAGAETPTTGTKGSTWALAGMYEAGPIYATLAYQTNKIGAALSGTASAASASALTDTNEKAWKLGGSYTMDQFQVNAIYEKTSDNFNAGAELLGHKAYYLGGKFNISSSDAVKLAFTKSKELAGGNTVNTGAKQVSLGYDHAMSKRTTVYALYTKLSNDASASYNLSSAAAVSTGAVTGAADSDPSAVSIGIKHTF